jgi:hypothetical protein
MHIFFLENILKKNKISGSELASYGLLIKRPQVSKIDILFK